jgi:hypothetical protein
VTLSPASFAQQWSALRKATHDTQHQIVAFLGRCPDARVIPFIKAFAQLGDAELAPLAVLELGRRSGPETRQCVEHLWKHHYLDAHWQRNLLISLRRLYLTPDPANV